MDQHNPYAAPQTAEFAVPIAVADGEWTPEHALGPEWRAVCAGAKKCRIAVIIVFLSILYSLLGSIVAGGLLRSRELANLVGFSMWGLMIAAWVFQLIGLIQLRKVALWSRAKGLFSTALGTFLMTYVGYIVFVIVMFGSIALRFSEQFAPGRRPGAQLGPVERELITMFGVFGFALGISYLIYNIVLLLGMRRIGFALKDNSIVRNSLVSLILFITLVVSYVSFIGFAFLGAGGPSDSGGFVIFMAIAMFIVFLVMIGFYGSALKRIADYAKSPQWSSV
jgi:hypothetical protein